MMNIRTIISIVIFSIIAGCNSGSGVESQELVPMAFTEIVISSSNLITDTPKRLTVVRNIEQFEVEWPRISSAPLPSIDFRELYVVIAEKGYQSSGHGYIAVTHVLSGLDFTEVSVSTFVPAANCDLIASLSSPFHVVAISNEKPVIFNESSEYLLCN